MTELATLPAYEMIRLYRSGQVSPLEVLSATEALIDKLDSEINAFVLRDPEGARRSALASEIRWQAGRPLGALDGVPSTVKDNLSLQGFPMRVGSLATSDAPASADAPCVLGLKAAGAVILGKTATTEFGWAAPGNAPHSGKTRNPWNLERTTGGSSSGAGAAAAAGYGPLHIGTDAGGSVRLPAAWCGLVGLKPTAGRIPNWPIGAFAHVASAGPMTRTVRDAALMFSAMARADRRDPFCLPDDPRDWSADIEAGVAGLRIGILSADNFETEFPAGDADAVRLASVLLEDAGAIVEPIETILPDHRQAFDRQWSFAVDRVVKTFSGDAHAKLDPIMVSFASDHDDATAIDFLNSEVEFAEFANLMRQLHRNYDLIMCPTAPEGPPLVDVAMEGRIGRKWTRWGCWTYLFNISRQPALSMPVGVDEFGLPRAVQIIGDRYQEDLVFKAARSIEKRIEMPWAR